MVHKALGYSKNIVQYTNKRELGLFNPHQLPTTTDVASHSVSIRKDEHGRTVFEHHTEAVKESYEELLMDMKPEEVTLGRMSNGIYSIVNEDKEIHPGDYDFRYSDDQKECFYQQGGHVYNLVSKNDNGSFVVMNPYNSIISCIPFQKKKWEAIPLLHTYLLNSILVYNIKKYICNNSAIEYTETKGYKSIFVL